MEPSNGSNSNTDAQLQGLILRLREQRDAVVRMARLSEQFKQREEKYHAGLQHVINQQIDLAIPALKQAAEEDHPAAVIWLHWVYSKTSSENANLYLAQAKQFFPMVKTRADNASRAEPDLLFCLAWGYQQGLMGSVDKKLAAEYASQALAGAEDGSTMQYFLRQNWCEVPMPNRSPRLGKK